MPTRWVVVCGAAGSGKSVIATALGPRLGWEVLDADSLHSPEAVAQMRAGTPLTEEQRGPWLERVRDWMNEHPQSVIACSALRRRHRDRLADDDVCFLQLLAGPDLLAQRVDHRPGHFMPATLVPGQLQALEPLQPDENGTIITSDRDVTTTLQAAFDALHRCDPVLAP